MEYRGENYRNELKYLIHISEYNYLKSRLKTTMYLDENANHDGEYHIRSLYFDDIQKTSYYEKESGVLERKKYRIRIYNKDDKVIKLEKKEKLGKYIKKSSSKITKELYYLIINNMINVNLFKDDPLLLEFYTQMRINNLKPAVIVDYFREPYIYKYGNVRITFDKRLNTIINSNDIFDINSISVSPKLDGHLILEVKYDDYLPEYIRNELKMQRHQLMAISKYAICRELKNSLNWSEGII